MRLPFTAVPPLTQLLIDRDQQNLYGGTAGGDLYWWKLDQGDDFPPQVASAGAVRDHRADLPHRRPFAGRRPVQRQL